MNQHRIPRDYSHLFANSEPEEVWRKAVDLVISISPTFEFFVVRPVFDDVVRLFRGEYPDYYAIKTPYHNLPHTLDVFLCAARLMHGVHVSGMKLDNREIALVLFAALLHDVGYAQSRDGKETGTGAQYTPTHVARGLEFMRTYAREHGIPDDFVLDLAPVISCSDPKLPISGIAFPNDRILLAGQILGTADLVGQMADRKYLEKLAFLFQEFEEARMGDFKSVHDMMRKTGIFYAKILKKLDEEFGGMYHKFRPHFKVTLGEGKNFYMESISKNMDYLAKISALDESEYLTLLRRGGIIKQFLSDQ
ncbi:MAG TPA: HD domain-containing protein [Gallionellaceae bacterium]